MAIGPGDPAAFAEAFHTATAYCLRAYLDIRFVLRTPEEVFARALLPTRPSSRDPAGANSSRSARAERSSSLAAAA